MAAAELRRLANDKAHPPPPQRWDKELVWIYCERRAAEQAMDVKSWKSSGDDSNSKLLDAASGRARGEEKKIEIKIKKACPSSYQSRQVFIPSGCRDPRATFIYWQGSSKLGIEPRDWPIFVSKLFPSRSLSKTRDCLGDCFLKNRTRDNFVGDINDPWNIK